MQYDSNNRQPTDFYTRDAKIVAQQLLGCKLIVKNDDQIFAGWIVETEAYLHRNDPACHASRGMTRSNRSMFGAAGLLYVYSIHAKYCMNVVTGKEGQGQAVLIRAIQPTDGLEKMVFNRNCSIKRDLCRGPSRLCQAVDIDRTWDGIDLGTSDKIWIEPADTNPKPRRQIVKRPRIGVTDGADLLLRFFINGNQFVSGRVGDHTRDPIHALAD